MDSDSPAARGGSPEAASQEALDREVGELYPAVLMLEATAVLHAPPYDAAAITGLREANAALVAAADAVAGARADDLFHERLTENCGNPELLEVVRPMRRRLMAYERRYFSTAERREGSAAQHGAIVDALEVGDHARAAALVRENFTTALPAQSAPPDEQAEA